MGAMLPRSRQLNAVYVAAFLIFVALLGFGLKPNVGQGLLGGASDKEEDSQHEFFEWHTRSQFRPVKQAVDHKSVDEICKAFPTHMLHDIQPVLKTGHGIVATSTKAHLDSVSACLGNDLLIVSDVDEEFQGYQLIDVIADLREDFKFNNSQLVDYYRQKELAETGRLTDGNSAQIQGWALDKFKFLPQVSRAWKMRPEKRWYIFYEDDTYIVWDNMFRLLANFNPDVPLYFGSPSPGARGTWMANGGESIVLSREAVRRLVKADFDKKGSWIGSKLSESWEEQMMVDCCGDSILGLAVYENASTTLSGLWPMFNPHPIHGVPFSDSYWCQPVISMHKSRIDDMKKLWRWEETRREPQRPLLYRDLAEFLKLSEIAVRDDWLNSNWGGYPAPDNGRAHESFEQCGEACKVDDRCFQWTYHLRTCELTPNFRLGEPKAAEVEEWRSEEEKAKPWTREDKRFKAGWDLAKIKAWIGAEGRDCKQVQWVRPSLERIF